jgi:hypothetical protein
MLDSICAWIDQSRLEGKALMEFDDATKSAGSAYDTVDGYAG